jgi:hypothetical protein
MPDRSEAREYESGVADVLSFLHGDKATVERDVHLPAVLSGGTRQIDVLVRGNVFGEPNMTMAVDCKRYKSRLDIGVVDAFLNLLSDVAADLGMLVTTCGASDKAIERLRVARGARVRVLSLDDLARWMPSGTVLATVRLAAANGPAATKALRKVGLRVRPDNGFQHGPHEVVLTAFAHWGSGSADDQTRLLALAGDALVSRNIPFESVSHGVTIGGGTPAHRWLEVIDRAGQPHGIKILASDEQDVDSELERIATMLGLCRDDLDVARPQGWPPVGLFGIS